LIARFNYNHLPPLPDPAAHLVPSRTREREKRKKERGGNKYERKKESEKETTIAETLSCCSIKTSTALLTEPRTRSFLFLRERVRERIVLSCHKVTKQSATPARTSGVDRLIFRSERASRRRERERERGGGERERTNYIELEHEDLHYFFLKSIF